MIKMTVLCQNHYHPLPASSNYAIPHGMRNELTRRKLLAEEEKKGL